MNLEVPWHPIIVHMPITLSLLVPLIFITTLIGIRKKNWPYKSWVVPVVFQIVLFLSALLAMKTGEKEEDVVENVVAREIIHEHEEWGERMVWYQGAVLALSTMTLLFPGRIRLKKLVSAASVFGVAVGVLTGHSGGQLVYKYNAGKAYLK